MRVISTFAHGALDYSIGFLLLVAGLLLGYSDNYRVTALTPIFAGLLVLLQALFTRYELGLFKLMPMRAHLAADLVIGAALALSPFALGFWREDSMWLPHVFAGLLIFSSSVITSPRPGPSWTDFRNNTVQKAPASKRRSPDASKSRNDRAA